MSVESFDAVLVGGGLQNGLMALALFQRQPGLRVALVERGARLGGNHTWAFHGSDLTAEAHRMVAPLISASWPAGHRVLFPGLERHVREPYAAVSSGRFHDVISAEFAARPHCSLRLGTSVTDLSAHSVRLSSGEELNAALVVDARGPERLAQGAAGFQKFVGLELALRTPVATSVATLMDATVPQEDGFRFFYVLPLAPDRVLVEDTRFSDHAALDQDALRAGVLRYAADQGLAVDHVVREEHGVLPLPMRHQPCARSGPPLVAGYQGGWFHPTTGYSFPVAARLAMLVASRGTAHSFHDAEWRAFCHAQDRQSRFGALLNRLLFRAVPPAERWRVFERFYTRSDDVIRRFYAAQLTRTDCLQILGGRPPQGISLRLAITEGLFA